MMVSSTGILKQTHFCGHWRNFTSAISLVFPLYPPGQVLFTDPRNSDVEVSSLRDVHPALQTIMPQGREGKADLYCNHSDAWQCRWLGKLVNMVPPCPCSSNSVKADSLTLLCELLVRPNLYSILIGG